MRRRLSHLAYYGAAFATIALILTFLPLNSEPWVWAKVAILGIGTLILAIGATRFSIWQRNEYWRERGRDPKHPERLTTDPTD